MDLYVNRGDSKEWDVTIADIQGALDLQNMEFWFTGKVSPNDGDDAAVFQKTLGSGITITDADDGKIRIVLAPADTANLQLTKTTRGYMGPTLYWDLQMVDEVGNVYTVEKGRMYVSADVTRST